MIRFSARCLACGKVEKDVSDTLINYDMFVEKIMSQGWCRRSFDILAWHEGGWFCGNYCAYESEYALKEEERQEERDEKRFYRNSTDQTLHSHSNGGAVLTFIFFVVAFWLYISKEYHHVIFK